MLMAVGLVGATVFAAVVVMEEGVEARLPLLAKAKVATPPADIFWNKIEALVSAITQVISEPLVVLDAGTVSTRTENVPNVPVFPVIELLASVQLTAVIAQFALGTTMFVVIGVPVVDTLIADGDAGVAVPAIVVVIAVGVEARLVAAEGEKVPVPAIDVICSLNTVL